MPRSEPSRPDKKPSALSEKLASLNSPVFQLEMEEDCIEPAKPICFTEDQFSQLKTRLQYLIEPGASEAEICQDVHACIRTVVHEEDQIDLVMLASKLSSYGYIPVLRTAPGGGHGVDCFKNLCHSFICLHTEAETDGRHIFVDPNFKEQFILQPRVEWYDSLLDIVPEVFVGDQSKIKEIVQLLTKAMAEAFHEQGCGTPPWRSSAALLSKWLPKKGIDRPVDGDAAGSPCKSLPVAMTGRALTRDAAEKHTGRARAYPRKVLKVKPLVSPVNLTLSCSQDASAGLTPCLLHQFSL